MGNEPYRDSIHIDAAPEDVFDYFTKPESLVRWMGDRAVLDPRPGGEFTVFIGDSSVEGKYVELDPPRRLVISWGRRGSPTFPPSTSTLIVHLTREGEGTRVEIVHHGLPESEADRHQRGWKHYLDRLRQLAADREPSPHIEPTSSSECSR